MDTGTHVAIPDIEDNNNGAAAAEEEHETIKAVSQLVSLRHIPRELE